MKESKSKTSVSAIVGIIFAVIALLLSAVPIVNNFAFVLAIIGLICGIIAMVGISKGKKSGKGLAIATIILSVVAFGIVLASQAMYGKALDDAGKKIDDSSKKMTGEKTDEILGKDVTVDLGTFSSTADEYGIVKTALPVKITNKLSEKKSFSVQIEAIDASGARIVDDTIYANDLGASQAQDFTAFQYVDSAKLDAVKTAKFKIVKVSEM